MKNFKTVKISPELHRLLKLYCVKNSFKLNTWIEEELKKIYDEKNNIKNVTKWKIRSYS